ncbi:rhodanese-like domain-containing protein [Agaribacter marinus]|uniref:Rhodanese n=1 Tax=Agaribacter marinus TaxID=1431249 RepID=A0AA37SW68_9ALTE|nr:rhodanese-like domain-containing protein [Agaribacter marinus]GLR69300.1 rhodanese [Agaribacter marinus]
MNYITEVPALESSEALAHFEKRLRYEADCWDVHEALQTGNQDFVVLDVRSSAMYEESHIPGAVSLPHGKIVEGKMKAWSKDTLFVVYCAGPHCNGANKAAIRLARLGRPVKELIGGMTGWADEGFTFATGSAPGRVLD